MTQPVVSDDPAALAELALTVARQAGELLLAGAADVEAVATKSSSHDLVTQMDRASEKLIRAQISAARPQDQVVGEEQGSIGDPSRVRWIVDPLDGTVNYFYGHPSWAVSIGVERDGVPCAGAVVAPGLREEYVGVTGQGSWSVRDGRRQRLSVSTVTDLADAIVGTGFGYVAQRRAHQGAIVAELLPRVRDIRRVGAAAVDLCWVASGRLDAYYERGLHEWDRSAGAVIAQEAGAVVAGLAGQPHSTQLLIAANPDLYRTLAAQLTALAATDGP